jgi:carbonic anhydrase
MAIVPGTNRCAVAEAFLLRNLGGRVKGSLSSLLYLEVTTDYKIIKEIAIIHHTGEPLTSSRNMLGHFCPSVQVLTVISIPDCGLTHSTDDAFHTALKKRHPDVSMGEIDGMEVGTYDGSDLIK